MPLKNHSQSIPGGYQFFQPETNWTAPAWQEWTQLRGSIINHRNGNPRFKLSTDPAYVEFEMDLQNTKRLESMPGTAHFLSPGPSSDASPPVFPHPPRRAAAAGVERLKNAAVGIGIVVGMFGPSADPVAPELSEKRAQVCAGTSEETKCPKNIRGDLLQRFTSEAMKGIHKAIELAKEMELKTTVDSRLFVCGGCDCSLKVKVHVPLDFIIAKTRPEIYERLDPRCWILEEKKSLA